MLCVCVCVCACALRKWESWVFGFSCTLQSIPQRYTSQRNVFMLKYYLFLFKPSWESFEDPPLKISTSQFGHWCHLNFEYSILAWLLLLFQCDWKSISVPSYDQNQYVPFKWRPLQFVVPVWSSSAVRGSEISCYLDLTPGTGNCTWVTVSRWQICKLKTVELFLNTLLCTSFCDSCLSVTRSLWDQCWAMLDQNQTLSRLTVWSFSVFTIFVFH